MLTRRVKKILLALLAALLAFIAAVDIYIGRSAQEDLIPVSCLPEADAIIVLGAKVYSDGSVSLVLAKRLDTALAAYKAGKAPKILVSGDHGSQGYDEVDAMKNYLLEHGVPKKDIFLDHAGFTTYDSLYRAKAIFCLDSAILVSQKLHLERALFIARQLGLSAKGAPAPSYESDVRIQTVRETGARVKAFFQAAIFKPQPRFLGDKIPVKNSDGEVTW